MKVDKSHRSSQYSYQFRFQLYPAKSILCCYLFLLISLFILISLLPVIMLFKLLALFVVAYSGVRIINNYFEELPSSLEYLSASNTWLINETIVQLQPEQFITRNLIILYLLSGDGKKLTHVIARDSMAQQQHRHLRKILLACLRSSPDEQLHPDRQS